MKFIRFLINLIIVFILLLGLGYLFRNPILTYFGEKYLSQANGAMVNIENLDNKIFTLDLNIGKMSITDKNKLDENLIEMENIDFALDANALFQLKFIVNNMSIDKLSIGTSRSEAGILPEKWLETEKEDKKIEEKQEIKLIEDVKILVTDKVEEEKNKIALINLDSSENKSKVEEVLALLDFQLQEEYKKSLEKLKERMEFWEKKIKDNEYKKRVDSLDLQIKNLDYDFKKLRNIKDIDAFNREKEEIENRIEGFRKLIKDTKNLVSLVETDKKLLEEEYKILDKIKDDFVKVARKDYERLQSIMSFDQDTMLEISLALFGENITNTLVYFLDLYSNLISTLSSSEIQEKEESIDKSPHLPRIWIKNIALNYHRGNKVYKGLIKNITSSQKIINEKTFVSLEEKKEDLDKNKINLTYDNRQEKRLSEINFQFKDFEFKNKNFNSSKNTLAGNILFGNSQLDMKLNMDFSNIEIVTKEIFSKESYRRILNEVTKNIKNINMDFDLNLGRSNQIKVASNLDNTLGESIKNLLNNEFLTLKKELDSKANRKLDSYINRFLREFNEDSNNLSLINKQGDELLKKIRELEEKEKNMTKEIEEAIKKQLEAEQDKLLEKGKDELKDLRDKLKDRFKI